MKDHTLRKFTAFLLGCCLLLTAFSGNAIAAQATELGIASNSVQGQSSSNVTTMPFYFRHFYDSSTFSSLKNSINSAVSFVNQVYMYNFPASAISTTDYPIAVDSISNLRFCTTGTESPCIASWGCGSYSMHHKDIENISNMLYTWRTNTYGEDVDNMGQIVVLWTNYEESVYCHYHESETTGAYVHECVNYLACVIRKRPVIHIMNLNAVNSNQHIPHMGLLLAHELAHCIGLDEQYESSLSATHGPDNTMLCIMDYFVGTARSNGATVYPAIEFRNRIVANYNLAFCDYCDASIRNLLLGWIDAYNYAVD